MPGQPFNSVIPLPKQWSERVRSAHLEASQDRSGRGLRHVPGRKQPSRADAASASACASLTWPVASIYPSLS